MIRNNFHLLFLVGLFLQMPAIPMQKSSPPPAKPAAEGQAKEDPFSRFHWLAESSEARGMRFETRKLANLKTDTDNLPTEVESEVVRPSANSMRVTRRVFDRSVNGERQLVEVVVEDLRAAPGNGISATKTVSRRDGNGSMRISRKEIQETVPAGVNAFRTQATVLVSRGGDSLTRSEEIQQLEKKRSEGVVEVERTQMLPDANGVWVPADRRVTSVRETNNQVLTQEEIYRQDPNGRFSLSQREVSREWKDQQGKEHKDGEIYRPNLAGSLDLNARTSIVRETYADGSEQTTQTLLQKSPVAPSEGLKLSEKIVATSRPAGSNSVQRDTEVLVPDANGRLQTIGYRRVIEKK